MSETEVKLGQIWRRKSDGAVVELIAVSREWDDWTYLTVKSPVRRGRIYGYNLRRRYELVQS